MKWNVELPPMLGQKRIVKKFLILPRTLPQADRTKPKQTRWLERAKIRQVYDRWEHDCGGHEACEHTSSGVDWLDMEWAD